MTRTQISEVNQHHEKSHVTCNSRLTLSIQAHRAAYSVARNEGPLRHYAECEVAFLAWPYDNYTQWCDHPHSHELWMVELNKYNSFGTDADPRTTVIGYVPIEVIAQVINANGGVKHGDIPSFDPCRSKSLALLAASMNLIKDKEKGYVYSKGMDGAKNQRELF